MICANPRCDHIKYAIRDIIAPAEELEKQGKKILKLNIGDPDQFDFDTPQFIKDALVEAVKDHTNNGYTASAGSEMLRTAIADREKRFKRVDLDPNKIIVTNGVSEALMFLFCALVGKGDEVLIPGPSYPPYTSYVKMLGAKPVEYKCDESNGWQPDVDDIASKISDKTRAFVSINPNNPTGALANEKTLKKMVDVLAPTGIPIISDEIYDLMTFKEPAHMSAVAKDVPLILLNGMSKVYLSPGWRIGSMAFRGGCDEIFEACMKQARIRLCANGPAQFAYAKALMSDHSHIKPTVEKLRERRDFAYKRLNEIDGLSAAKPEGAFYIFPKIENNKYKDDKEWVLELLKQKNVLTVFGSGFGQEYGKGHFRIVYLPPMETLTKAFDKIEEFMKV
ncbi:MAG: aminotransferase class I/II-fold pyridoxal phosphate-dependent enzyme [Candidatus Undinarchaeales archaeon]|jgi:aspartate/methionine/tyrosine aminotransferase|nr:aminotransferase class I/II-fold pyridoxal phosphate-dependent enzyme [Candidatus Undinarchaeales archaeon]